MNENMCVCVCVCGREDNIQMDLRGVGCECMKCSELVKGRV